MEDLIKRQDVFDVFKKVGICVIPSFTFERIWNGIEKLPSAEPERKIIRCADCKWWDRLEEGHPYGDCRACRSGTQTERWDIHIQRQSKFDFYCADAEPKEDDDDDE